MSKMPARKKTNKKKVTKFNFKNLLKFFLVIPVFLLFFFASFTNIHAANGVNKQINFQGKLVDNNGLNVADSTYTVIFSLYNVSSAGTAAWTETDSITTVAGVFQVPLGALTSLAGFDFNQDTWYLGIKVGADAEMTPRVRYSAVPYAFNADKLDGVVATNSATSFTLTGSTAALKTLTVADSTTLGTNAITFGGGEVLTLSATNALTLNTTALTNITLPTSGTLLTNTAAANQTITSTQTTGTVLGIADITMPTGAVVGQSITLSGIFAAAQTGLSIDLTNTSATSQTGLAITVRNAGANGISVSDGTNVNASLDKAGNLTLGKVSTTQGGLIFGNTSAFTTTFKSSNSTTASVVYTWPTADAGSSGFVLSSNASGALSWVVNGAGGGCTSCLIQSPTSNTAGATGANVVAPTAASIVGLMINTSTNATTADGLDVVTAHSSGTAINGILFNQNAAGTTTNALNITQTLGTLSNGVNFSGSIANDITTGTANRNLTINPNGTGAVNISSGVTTGNGLSLTVNSLTTGNGLLLTSTGTITGTGKLASLVGNNNTTGNVLSISGTGTTTGNVVSVIGGSAVTTGSDLYLNGAIYKHTVAETGSLAVINFNDQSSDVTGADTTTTNGLNILSQFTTTGAASKNINGISIAAPSTQSCTGGACTWTGLKVTTPASIAGVTASGVTVTAGGVPGADLMSISTNGNGVTASGTNALQITYDGGAANIESGALRINLNPGSTGGAIWDATRVVANAIGPGSGVTETGVKVEGPTTGGAGTFNGINLINLLPGTNGIANGVQLTTSAITQAAANTATTNGIVLTSAGTLSTITAAGTINWNGESYTTPQSTVNFAGSTITTNGSKITTGNITQTTGSVTANGLNISLGTITTGGTQNGISITPSSSNANGTEVGIAIGSLTAGAATQNALTIGSGWNNDIVVNGTAILNGSGVLQNSGLSGTYSNSLTLSNTGNAFTGTTLTLVGGQTNDIKTNGATTLKLDTGGAAGITLGGTNATSLTLGRGASEVITLTLGSDAIGDIFYRNSSGNIARLADVASGSCLNSGGVGAIPTWSTCSAGGGTRLDQITSATATSTLANVDNAIVWNWAPTTVGKTDFTFGATAVPAASTTNTALAVSLTHTSNTMTNGFLVNSNGAGGTTTNAIQIQQSAGTLTNGILFSGTITKDIVSASGTAGTALSFASGAGTAGNGGAVTINAGNGAGAAFSGGGITLQGGNGPTNGGSITLSGGGGSTVTSTAGSINIDGGVSPGTNGSVNIGTANAQTVSIGNGAVGETDTIQFATSTCTTSGSAEGLIFKAGSTQEGHFCYASGTGMKIFANSTITSGTDVAENYSDMSNTLEPGDVVALDTTGLRKSVVKINHAYSPALFGVVSTNPGVQLSDISENNGATELVHPKPIALTGRIPTKVSTENGNINIGDYMTSSSIPGVAMKATHAGYVIGQALENYSGTGVSKILVFARTAYFNGLNGNQIVAGLSGNIDFTQFIGQNIASTMQVTSDGKLVINAEYPEKAIRFDKDGNATFAGTISAKAINVDQIIGLNLITDQLATLSASIASLSGELISTPSATFPDVLHTATLTVDSLATISGNLRVQHDALFESMVHVIDTLTTSNLLVTKVSDFFGTVFFHGDINFAGRPTFNSDTAGFALIKKDADHVDVIFSKVYANTPIVTTTISLDKSRDTASQNILEQGILQANYGYIVTNKTIRGFTILLSKKATTDVLFSWSALSINDAQVFQSDSTVHAQDITPKISILPTPIISIIPSQ